MIRITKYSTIVNGQTYEIEIFKDGLLKVNGEERSVDFHNLSPSVYSVLTNHRSYLAIIGEESGPMIDIQLNGRLYSTEVYDERSLLMDQRKGVRQAASGEVKSPMPGLIVSIPVNVEQEVHSGDTLIVLESMKMQNELKSPIQGVVRALHCQEGDTVEKGALLVAIDAIR
ncbi:MAG: acetyl-CoA carboxylase biotin carboxyl carrier protein subunit [Anaerolineaceae bacterium]|nr:acetyl-CoA carboxylase biotin carboxyl carrier protein subunit [Chloroflexota bacterium]MCY4008623.1 acetyl-CoA carboxylase biotin carboxyl carrier protein subunit [Anaerolineaceae bacterium]